MSSTDEAYVPPMSDCADPLPSVEIMVGNFFTGYTHRGMTAEEMGLTLDPNGHWVERNGMSKIPWNTTGKGGKPSTAHYVATKEIEERIDQAYWGVQELTPDTLADSPEDRHRRLVKRIIRDCIKDRDAYWQKRIQEIIDKVEAQG